MHRYQTYYFPFIWVLFLALMQLVGSELLRYQGDLLSNAELWRLLTAHMVHLNWMHWLLNSLGMLLLVAITHVYWSVSKWLLLIVVHSLFISLAFLWLNPELNWYVGFSGVLYGLYAVAAISILKKDKIIALLLLLFVSIKIIIEQGFGDEFTSRALLDSPVVVDAHAYGFVCGLICALIGGLMVKKSFN